MRLEKVGWIRDAAGARFDRIELSAQLLECAVTDRPEEHLADFADGIATWRSLNRPGR